MSDPYREPGTITTAREAFEDFDRQFVEAVRRVMTAETSEATFAVTRHVNWTEFRRELARLNELAELRHAAKHAATLEAHITVPIMVLIPTPSGSDPK